jgi:hypothetical protein
MRFLSSIALFFVAVFGTILQNGQVREVVFLDTTIPSLAHDNY